MQHNSYGFLNLDSSAVNEFRLVIRDILELSAPPKYFIQLITHPNYISLVKKKIVPVETVNILDNTEYSFQIKVLLFSLSSVIFHFSVKHLVN